MARCLVCQTENAAESTNCIKCGSSMKGGSLRDRKSPKTKIIGIAIAVGVCLLAVAISYGYLNQGSTTVIANMDSKLELAIKYLSENQYEKAIIAYQEIIKIDPKNVEAYQGLSLAFVLNNQSDKAKEALQQGLQRLPGNYQLQLILAGLWSDQGKNEEVEALYKEMIVNQPGLIPVYEAYYHWLASMGRVEEAISLLENALLQDKSYLIFNWLAALYSEMGMEDQYLEAVRDSLTLQPNQWKAYELVEKHFNYAWNEISSLADQYIAQGHIEIGTVLKLKALFGQGAYQELIQQYQQSSQETKDNYLAKYLLAQACLQMEQKENALETLVTIPIDELNDAELISKVAEYYLDMGELDKARELALRGIELDDSLIDNYLLMFRSYAENEAESKVWALRYLMNSGLGYTSHQGFYQGEFTGQYSGAEAGNFAAVIDHNKNVEVTGQSPMLGLITGSGQLSESGNLSFNASGSITAGVGMVFTVSFNGEMRVENGSINASGTWYSVSFPQIAGTWAITPVPWESSVTQVLASFAQSNSSS